MIPDPAFWSGKRVLVTGHTGFKGSWLSLWLELLGARVHGFALPPETQRGPFVATGLHERVSGTFGDVRDSAAVSAAVAAVRPELVFHLAAQPLVRRSYREPVATFAANVMGTAHVLEASRGAESVRAVVLVTSDKCYRNREWVWGYREEEALGGDDPYSASKAAAELVAHAYRRAFCETRTPPLGLATARAGNVFGGGDWAEDRLVPDVVRALSADEAIVLRNPASVRPWQHVLEPLCGYLLLGERLWQEPGPWSGPWNFGPHDDDAVPVKTLVADLAQLWGGGGRRRVETKEGGPAEARVLRLDASLARTRLGWRPRLSLARALGITVEWYRALLDGGGPEAMDRLTRDQIARYVAAPPLAGTAR